MSDLTDFMDDSGISPDDAEGWEALMSYYSDSNDPEVWNKLHDKVKLKAIPCPSGIIGNKEKWGRDMAERFPQPDIGEIVATNKKEGEFGYKCIGYGEDNRPKWLRVKFILEK